MIFRIFIGLIIVLAGFFVYDSIVMNMTKSAMHDVPEAFIFENPEADITVVEYMDYQCPQCQGLHPVLMRAIARDGRVRFIPKPVFMGAPRNDVTPAHLVYAAGRQGKFKEAHNAMITNYRAVDGAVIEKFAKDLDLDLAQFKSDLKDPELFEYLKDNFKQLKALKGYAVPSVIVNNELIFVVDSDTYPSVQELVDLFGRARGS